MAIEDTIQALAVLSQGRAPSFTAQSEVDVGSLNGPPPLTTSGVPLTLAADGPAVVALAVARLREKAHTRKVIVSVETSDATALYTVTLAGVDYDYQAVGGDVEADILDGIQAIVDAGPYTAAVVGTTVEIIGDTTDSYSAVVSATATGELSIVREASRVALRVWLRRADSPYDWHACDEVETTTNWVERYVVAGFDRMWVEIVETNGTVTPAIGPCDLE